MDAVLNWLWQGSVVALACFALLRLLERARARFRYLVCWAALLLIVVLPALPWLASLGLRHERLTVAPAGAIVAVPDAWWTSATVIVVAWAAWASVYTARFVWALIALRRARGRSQAFPTQVESLLSHWRHVREEGRRPSLVMSEAVTAAAVLGCGSPVIAIAPSLVAALDSDELDRVVIHEWAHVQRRDDLFTILQVFVRLVAGWHPATWWIHRRLHVEREIACDEIVIEVTGSAKRYAACLVKLAGLNGGERTALAPAVLTASGLRARVTRIVSRRVLMAPLLSRGIAVAIVSALCLLSVVVGGLRLVEAAVLALPVQSLLAIGTGIDSVAPAAIPTFAEYDESARSPIRRAAARPPARGPIAEEPPPVRPAAADAWEQRSAVPEGSVVPTELQATAVGGADPEEVLESAVLIAAVPTQPPQAAVEESRSIWRTAADGGAALGRTAADGGTVIGRKSKEAGVATAGFFTRFGRRVAGAF
jgi:beta-lactamase regulating signal transducer with metallopeptidase domain